jgi:hypothetical protein
MELNTKVDLVGANLEKFLPPSFARSPITAVHFGSDLPRVGLRYPLKAQTIAATLLTLSSLSLVHKSAMVPTLTYARHR